MKFKYYSIIIFLICIVVFILQSIIPGFTDLFVLNNSAIHGFQIWRFLTAIFLHASLIHLIFNMFALLLFGFILESKIGSRNFLILFLISGIFGNLISVNFYDSSLGASGAIYGIIGCLAVLSPFMGVWAFGLLMPMFIAAIIWITGDILGLFFPSDIGNIAHLSGIAVGLVFGIVFRILNKNMFKKIKKEEVIITNDYVKAWEEKYMR